MDSSITELEDEAEDEDEIGKQLHGSKDVVVLIHLIVPAVKNELHVHEEEAKDDHDPAYHTCLVLHATESKLFGCNQDDNQHEYDYQEVTSKIVKVSRVLAFQE